MDKPKKGCNLVRDPRVSLLVVDPEATPRYIEIRGQAEMVYAGCDP